MIEVFKTNVYQHDVAKEIVFKLARHFPEKKINFDLEDCDNILRIEGTEIIVHTIQEILNEAGFECERLD